MFACDFSVVEITKENYEKTKNLYRAILLELAFFLEFKEVYAESS